MDDEIETYQIVFVGSVLVSTFRDIVPVSDPALILTFL